MSGSEGIKLNLKKGVDYLNSKANAASENTSKAIKLFNSMDGVTKTAIGGIAGGSVFTAASVIASNFVKNPLTQNILKGTGAAGVALLFAGAATTGVMALVNKDKADNAAQQHQQEIKDLKEHMTKMSPEIAKNKADKDMLVQVNMELANANVVADGKVKKAQADITAFEAKAKEIAESKGSEDVDKNTKARLKDEQYNKHKAEILAKNPNMTPAELEDAIKVAIDKEGVVKSPNEQKDEQVQELKKQIEAKKAEILAEEKTIKLNNGQIEANKATITALEQKLNELTALPAEAPAKEEQNVNAAA